MTAAKKLHNAEMMMSEEQLEHVAGGTLAEVKEMVAFYRTTCKDISSDFKVAAQQVMLKLRSDLQNIHGCHAGVSFNFNGRFANMNNLYKVNGKRYSHAQVMAMIRKKYHK